MKSLKNNLTIPFMQVIPCQSCSSSQVGEFGGHSSRYG